MRSQSQAELDPLGSGWPHSPHPLIPRMTSNLSKGSLSIRSGFGSNRKQAWKTKSPSHAKKMNISFVLATASSTGLQLGSQAFRARGTSQRPARGEVGSLGMCVALRGHPMSETRCLGFSWVSEQGCGSQDKSPLLKFSF